ncbi:ABC transporter ATP-binding protein [Micromonospora sp. NPDC049497]|uniref:ABC transporter ATP-binding protein n=1 Tax=Micromonospora sp. NPDC049497 TaxID=3364273 RepID=UPI0037AAD9FC
MAVIEVEGLCKDYGALRAVDDVSFTVEQGEVLALLGPNGAGKTTTVEILEGYRDRSGGRVSVLGYDPAQGRRAYRERIGIVLQSAGFEEDFTVRETARLHARLYPRVHDPDQVLELVGLADKSRARIKTLSGGQRRRLDLALGLIGCPEVLFLDEPTTGFDPSARHRAWDLVAGLRKLGTTILLTTHYIEEAQRLADRVAVLRGGRLLVTGRPDALTTDAGSVLRFRLPTGLASADLPRLDGHLAVVGDVVEFRTTSPTRDANALTGWALDHGVDLPDLTLTRPSLEDVYLRLVEEGTR